MTYLVSLTKSDTGPARIYKQPATKELELVLSLAKENLAHRAIFSLGAKK